MCVCVFGEPLRAENSYYFDETRAKTFVGQSNLHHARLTHIYIYIYTCTHAHTYARGSACARFFNNEKLSARKSTLEI